MEVNGVWVAVNGRVDNREQILDSLPDSVSTATSDVEIIGHAYNRWGIDFLSKLVGAYAMVIWDAEQSRLYCARDKTGIRSLYFVHTQAGELLVASEIRAIKTSGADWRVNKVSLASSFWEKR